MLRYNLVENLLVPDSDVFMAQVSQVTSFNIEEIAERMLKRGTLLTKADILAALEVYHSEIADIIADGNAINTPLFNAFPSISGVFNGAADGFDSSRHKLRINLNAGMLLRNAISKVRVEKIHLADPIPYIIEVKDILSGTTNENLSPGGVVKVFGSRLKFLESKPENGLFLIKEDGTSIRCNIIVENKPGLIIASLPASLDAGAYVLEVRSSLSSGKGTIEVRNLKIGRFVKVLNV